MHLPLRSLNRFNPILLLLIVTALTFGGMNISAQDANPANPDAPWSVYLSNYTEVQISQFNPDGSVVTYALPEGSQTGLGADSVAFAPDERRIAYCSTPPVSTDPNAAPAQPPYTLTVRDLAGQTNVFDVSLGELAACSVTGEAFSTDGSRLAVGTIPPFPEQGVMPEGEASWQLQLIDAATGEVLDTLDSLSPQLSELGYDTAQMLLMPYTRRVEGDRVYFALVNWFTEGQPSYDAFAWDTNADTVTEAPLWGRPFADEIPTVDGVEFAYPMLDEDQPAANPGGPTYEANTVVVQREDGEPVVVYTNTEEVITSVRYIDDGAALAVGLLAPFEPAGDVPGQQPVRTVRVSRDGTVSEIAEPVNNASIEVLAVPGGYIDFTRVYNPENNALNYTLDAVIGGEGVNLWSETSDLNSPDSVQWTLIHATYPDLSDVSLPEFTPTAP